MAKFRMVRTEFWKNPMVLEEMTPEDKYFYLYLLTNPNTTQIGIYQITKKQMAFDLGYSIESVQSLMERFIEHHKLIRYNTETRELAIKNWGKDNLYKGGKPVMDCIRSELKDVEDHSLIQYVSESIQRQEFRSLYESYYKNEKCFSEEDKDLDADDTYLTEYKEHDDTFLCRHTIRGQKEKEKQKEKQKQQQKKQEVLYPNIDNNPDIENSLQSNQKNEDVKEIVEFWDENGFGLTNINAKEQLLSWLDESHFSQPKEMILKAMNIACANNKRRLNYIAGILKNWENESLLTVEEVDSYDDRQKPIRSKWPFIEFPPAGRAIPSGFILDLTAGEE
ncbi:DnaD domain protein [Neobacillus mesonae]|uniref:DnaD domain-containing protein n=1 Tax=Neobacillus mesonae TaxID=1193713 RepID=UPI00203F3D2E|nr:DnaD domain protein [Neobacillus mesonae]MCM3568106.1 DnaD domain protein [Neobacillus mesonae]